MTSESYTLAGVDDEGESLDLLIARARAGEESAFEEILARFESKALGIARNLGAGDQDAEDIAQESFLRLFRHIGSYRGGRRFTAYFFRIVVNVTRDHFRKAAAERQIVLVSGSAARDDSLSSQGPSAAHDLEVRQRTRAALMQLTLREREIVILKDMQGLSVWEISRILRLDPITVRRHAMRARIRLRDLLGR